MMYSTKQMQNTSAASPSPDELRAQHQGLPRVCCCPSALLPPGCAGCRRLGLFPGCKTKILFIPPFLCPVHPGQLNPTAPGLGQSILAPGWCWCVFWGVCVCTVCVYAPTVAGEGAQNAQSCPVTLCTCFVSQLSAGCRARTVGAAPSPADAPACPAGWGEPARQVPAVPLTSGLPASGLPCCCRESFSREQQGCHGALEVLCPQTDPLVGDREQHRGSSPGLGTCLVLLRPQRGTAVLALRTHTCTPTRIPPGQRCLMVWPGEDGKLSSQGSSDLSLAASVLPALMCSPGIHIFSPLLLRAGSA